MAIDEPAPRTLLYWPAWDADDNPVALVRDDDLAQLCDSGDRRWFAPNDAAEPLSWAKLQIELGAGGLRLEDAVQVQLASLASARQWRWEMPAPAPWLSSNEQRSGSKHWTDQADAITEWRKAGNTHAIAAGLRSSRVQLDRVEVTAVVRFPDDGTLRDSPNMYPSIKAVIDGALVDTGVLPDDNDRHVAGLTIRPGPPIPVRPYNAAGRLTITVREVPVDAQA